MWALPDIVGIVVVPLVFHRHVSTTAEAPQIQVVRPVLVPQVATQQLISHVMTEEVQADAAFMQSAENFAEGPPVQMESC